MSDAGQPVLDASALVAYLTNEPGADVVAETIAGGASISTVSLAEALSTAAGHGADPAKLATELIARGLLNGAVTVEPFIIADAIETARLRPLARGAGLSLGDRACLALGRRLATAVLTADTAWSDLAVGIQILPIR
jgi:ribonuclease VapC